MVKKQFKATTPKRKRPEPKEKEVEKKVEEVEETKPEEVPEEEIPKEEKPEEEKKEEEEKEEEEKAEEAEEPEEPEAKKPKVDAAATKNGCISNTLFETADISDNTKNAIRDMGFTNMTEIQANSLGPLMKGKDLMGKASTGSGKSLAFLVPTIELLYKSKFTPRNGTGAIVLSPTRELALQLYEVVTELMRYHSQTHCVIIGGASRKSEEEKLCRGMNLVIATPGRLLDHLHNTRGFVFKHLKVLVIDEADRIMQQGFEEEMHQILKILPKTRQTVLFSATMTEKVEDIARLSLTEPVYVDVASDRTAATVDTLEQGYVVAESDLRFRLLFTFLKKNRSKKVIVFFSSCAAVKFHSELLNYVDIPVMDLHGQQKQNKRTATFFEFCQAKSGILLTTDVAARGLDIPSVDWIIQYDPPDKPEDYIHRVGRTARMGTSGRALIFLLPNELAFLSYLKAAKVPLNQYEFSQTKIAAVQTQLENLIEKNYYLNKSARDAFKSYIQAYASHSLKDIFDVHKLDIPKVARAFGFSVPPKIGLGVFYKSDKPKEGPGAAAPRRERQNRGPGAPKGNANRARDITNAKRMPFSASNPYGKRSRDDKRQFIRT